MLDPNNSKVTIAFQRFNPEQQPFITDVTGMSLEGPNNLEPPMKPPHKF